MTTQWLSALKVVGIYAVLGTLWILFSDKILEITISDPALVSRLQTIKGWFYVLVTAVLLFVLISRALELIENANRLDPLTQLLRHQLFRERLDVMLEQALATSPVALIYLDIDHFNELNKRKGTDGADRLLRNFAYALRENSRASSLLARISTDQFAIAIPSIMNIKAAENEAQLLRQLLQKVAQNFSVELTCSIGIALAPMDGRSAKTLMTAASTALVQTKKDNRSGTLFFNHELSKRESDRQEMLQDLRNAISEGALSLVYQPQFHTANLSLCGVEALLRWQHPNQGFIGPDIFIPLAEENGLMPQLSAFVVERSYTELKPLLGTQISRVSLNVSALEFSSPTLIEQLLGHLQQKSGYMPYLQIEITETAAIENLGASIELVERLRKRGLRLSLDDFGTGFSSLAMLKDLPIDEVKIDRSFVFDLTKHQRAQSIVTALVGIANDFDITVVAEGVETQEQRELLHKLGCHELQGYLLSPPKPIAQLMSSIEQAKNTHKQL